MPSPVNKLTREKFITKARAKHGDRYDYTEVIYINCDTKVKIYCKTCENFFEQVPYSHYKSGCNNCYGKHKMTTEKFIIKAKKIHGEDKFDYSKVDVTNKKIIIKCVQHNNEFIQNSQKHLQGQNSCKECRSDVYDCKSFIAKSQRVHGEKYDYSEVIYIDSRTPVKINCKKCKNAFYPLPYVHVNNFGCNNCGGSKPLTTNTFINRSKELYPNDEFDYSKVKYTNNKTHVKLICIKHQHEFLQNPQKHLGLQQGCSSCRGRVETKEDFIKKAKKVHKNKYDYSKVNYINSEVLVTIICPLHGEFNQRTCSHLSGCGCPKCCHTISKGQLQWIQYLEIKDGKNKLEHEYKISGSMYKADAYNFTTNTIFEYHGDLYHGNPKYYDMDDINPKSKTTFGTLYQLTLKKENFIKHHPSKFNFERIWESEWKKGIWAIKKLQRYWKKYLQSRTHRFICKECKFQSNHKSDYTRHCQTLRHKKKIEDHLEILTQEDPEKFVNIIETESGKKTQKKKSQNTIQKLQNMEVQSEQDIDALIKKLQLLKELF
jgi:hypothetical protein